MTSHPKQHLFEIYFKFFFLQIKLQLPDKNPAVCKALVNVIFYYVGDYNEFWF